MYHSLTKLCKKTVCIVPFVMYTLHTHTVLTESFFSTSSFSPHPISVALGQTAVISCGDYTSIPDVRISWEIYDEDGNFELLAETDKAIAGLNGELFLQDAGSLNNVVYECVVTNRDIGEVVNGFVQVTVQGEPSLTSSLHCEAGFSQSYISLGASTIVYSTAYWPYSTAYWPYSTAYWPYSTAYWPYSTAYWPYSTTYWPYSTAYWPYSTTYWPYSTAYILALQHSILALQHSILALQHAYWPYSYYTVYVTNIIHVCRRQHVHRIHMSPCKINAIQRI